VNGFIESLDHIERTWTETTTAKDECPIYTDGNRLSVCIDDEDPDGRMCNWDRFAVYGLDEIRGEMESPIYICEDVEDFLDFVNGGSEAYKVEAQLCREWEEWCEAQELPCISADELEAEEGLSRKQREFVQTFITNWEALQSCIHRNKEEARHV